ncbi:hypothetical protein ACFQDP_00795 [Methylorubrum zatmanii]|uniref:Uncharacterized protein n=1 Tax=Methylorubrum zatmanii TaxID=29429 RepID=A0ABW1WLD7_9HYPH
MTDSATDSVRRALAARLSREMDQAEDLGFGTATVWLTREEIDLIRAALTGASSGADTARLDFLDRCVAAMTAHTGSGRAWQLTIDRDHLRLGTTDAPRRAGAGFSPTCRAAIDARLAELERARAAASDDNEGAPDRSRRLTGLPPAAEKKGR